MAKHIQGPRRTLVCALSAWLVFAAFGSHSLKAQGTAAVISGTVTDASGAVVGDAAVQAKNLGSSATQTVMTDAQGRYRLPDLGIGDYELQVSKAGFQTTVRSGITLSVGSQPSSISPSPSDKPSRPSRCRVRSNRFKRNPRP